MSAKNTGKKIAIIGAGVIGLSWAKLFKDSGWTVAISDPRKDLKEVVATVFKTDEVICTSSLEEAVKDADFIQENGPERLEFKREMLGEIAKFAPPHAIIASSSSSILPSEMAEGNSAADRILIGHPFNPPEIMPLVEIVPGKKTSQESVDKAFEIYQSIGKTPQKLKKEINGFVGNRLQKAFLDEVYYLVQQGIIEAKDMDQLVKDSLGLRWAVTGPLESNHLGGGPGGIRHLFEGVLAQLNTFKLTPASYKEEDMKPIADAVEKAYGTGEDNYEKLTKARDKQLLAVLKIVDA